MSFSPRAFLVAIGAALLFCACSGSSSGTDGGAVDSGGVNDAGPTDAGPNDAGPSDAGPADAGFDAGPVDAGDNGAPSTDYPAPHPPLPTLVNASQGPVLTTPTIHLAFYPNDTRQADLQTYAQSLSSSTYWTATTSEYGVTSLSAADPVVLTGQTAPQTISQSDLETWVASQLASGALGVPDPQGIYTFVFPSGTTITEPNPITPLLGNVQSCVAFLGYHDHTAMIGADGGPVADGGSGPEYAFAVIPTCSTSLEDLTEVMSHEWVESSTDPFFETSGVLTTTGGPTAAYFGVDADHFVWDVLGGGGEAGDLCISEGTDADITPADVGHLVQRTWSNTLASASHDPCAPDLAGEAFFAAAPVLEEPVSFTTAFAGTISTKGLTIPVGTSKTVEVDLFSDGDTHGPFNVRADDLLYRFYGSYGIANSLAFQWDRTSGLNGEKLHLTITVSAAATAGLGGGHVFMITATHGSQEFVWPGLIVE